ncbi:MAG: GTPase ObgE [Clostridiales bacterium]|nr:GTPase ObgE [Clostridiales bacterium]
MFIDKARIRVRSGKGGDGAVSFHREKFVNKGGPDGGDGGKGGDVIFEIDPNLNTLIDFKYRKKYVASDGKNGAANNMYGRGGEDIVVRVPAGTVVKDAETGRIIADMTPETPRVTILEGGRGGRGNTKYKNAIRQLPRFSQLGMPSKDLLIDLELRIIADVGIIGFPNVGKSTMLSIMTYAKPKIADYHFTTLSPNLGVVRLKDASTFILADIPGLIEGAHEGQGLGHDFLRHIARTRMFIHLVDISGSEGRDPVEDFHKINEELRLYNPELIERKQIVVAGKSDLTEDNENFERLKAAAGEMGFETYSVTAYDDDSYNTLITKVADMLIDLPETTVYMPEPEIIKAPEAPFTIRVEDGVYIVEGELIDKITRSINIEDYESLRYFQSLLEKEGIIKALRKAGAKDGDEVSIKNVDFDFID